MHGYSFLKIIQIYLKTSKEISKSRQFIKYLSSIEEIILSSMAFSNDSSLWNDIKLKGILKYNQIQRILSKTNNSLSPTNNNLSPIINQSPNKINVSKKLFFNSNSTTTTTNQINVSLFSYYFFCFYF